MKVICIGHLHWYYENRWRRRFFWSKKEPVYTTGPKKDDIVTVESEYWSEGKKYYRLVEWPKPNGGGYNSEFFRPLQESTTDLKEVTFTEIKKEVPAVSEN